MKDPRVDAYMAKSADFAKPVLEHLRALIHTSCPEAKETIKWGFPNFEYNGIILCSMASFKNHCAFNFWRGKEMEDPAGILEGVGKTAMGNLGRITNLQDLPSDEVLSSYLSAGMRLNEAGKKPVEKAKAADSKELLIDDYFLAALANNPQARDTFNSFSYSNKRDYVAWLQEAKTEATRQKRLNTAVEWLAEGKVRNWKYIKQK